MNIAEMYEKANAVAAAEMADGKITKASIKENVNIGEMIGTSDGAEAFVTKVVTSVYEGIASVPLLYGPIYSKVSDPSLPQVMTVDELGDVQTVFLRHFEGGEVKFGSLGKGKEKTVRILTYSSGIELGADFVRYNQTWRIGQVGASFGRAYNHLLNHLHLGPITTGTYANSGTVTQRKAAQKAGTAQQVNFNTDVETTLGDALKVLPKGSIVLHNSADTLTLESAIAGSVYKDGTPSAVKKAFGNATYIEYDGVDITVGDMTYNYPGVAAGEFYLVSGSKTNFQELEKDGLAVDQGNADISRLILEQIVGTSRRGAVAGIGGENGAIKVKLA